MPDIDPFTSAWIEQAAAQLGQTQIKKKRRGPLVSPVLHSTETPKKVFAKTKDGLPIIIKQYKKGSKSASAIAKALNIRRDFEAAVQSVIINWGSASADYFAGIEKISGTKIINSLGAVAQCRDKVKFFKLTQSAADGPRIPQVLFSADEALLLVQKGETVFGRAATGSCGTDIVQFDEDPGRFQSSDFFSVYKKKKSEFRVHLFKGKDGYDVLDLQQKVLRQTDPETNEPINKDNVNFMIRNHRNGFIFQRNDIKVPDDVIAQAKKAATVVNIDFGAVDVIYNESEGKAYVLEINTAPGLEGQTLDHYVSKFKEILGL